MLETILDRIDGSIAESHLRLAEGWQEWTGTDNYYREAHGFM